MCKPLKICVGLWCLLLPLITQAQQDNPISADSVEKLKQPLSPLDSLKFFERRLVTLGQSIITARSQDERTTSTYYMARTLVAALKQPNSFEYPFDSVSDYISILTDPDKKFRIFTWSLKWGSDENVTADSFEFYGAIQINNPEKLELYGLYDSSSRMDRPEFITLPARFWYGALYYDMAVVKYKKKKYYTLLGWDDHTMASNRKIIDILVFDDSGRPQFGSPVFKMNGDDKPAQHRVIFEFRDDARMTLRYIEKKKLIVFETLEPPNPNSVGMYETYLPDGGYDYLEFKKGYWLKKKHFFKNVKNIPMEEFEPNYQR